MAMQFGKGDARREEKNSRPSVKGFVCSSVEKAGGSSVLSVENAAPTADEK